MRPIPNHETQPVKDAFNKIWKAIEALDIQRKDVDIHGHRITNAGDGRTGSDYVTLRQLREISKDPHVVTQVRIITEVLGVGPWTRVGTAILPVNTGDQVGIGLGVLPSATPKLHVRSAAAGTFPTLGAADFFVLENSGNTNLVIITGATSDGRIQFYGSGDATAQGSIRYNRNTQAMSFSVTATARVQIITSGSVLLAVNGALATTATDGFTYLPTCAGPPTGVPTAQTGMVPIVIDSTNSKAYIYSGGAWVALN